MPETEDYKKQKPELLRCDYTQAEMLTWPYLRKVWHHQPIGEEDNVKFQDQ
jgi:hypothetical protein